MKISAAGFCICLIALSAAGQSKSYDLPLKPENIEWGYYDGGAKPVLRVSSGDTIHVETIVARGMERLKAAGLKDEEIPASLKAVEAGRTVKDVCREHEVSDATYYKWKTKYGGMEAADIRRLRELEDENRRLKQMSAELLLENRALKDVIAKKL